MLGGEFEAHGLPQRGRLRVVDPAFPGLAAWPHANPAQPDGAGIERMGEWYAFRKVAPDSGHWIAFRLTGVSSNRDGLGAVVRLSLSDGRTLYNHATTSVGYACSSEPLVRFGLGSARVVESAEIRWPSGIVQRLGPLEADRMVPVSEPAGVKGEGKR